MKLFLDIETLPTSDESIIADIAATIKAPAQYKKPESIAEWMAENKDAELKKIVHKTGLDGLFGSIACICYAFDDGEVFSQMTGLFNEAEMLEEFFSHVEKRIRVEHHSGVGSLDLVMVGHNVVGFDLPFIKHRAIINRVVPPNVFRKAFNAKPWDNNVADTMLMWSSDREKRASMDKLCKAFGIAGKGDFDGSMVADTWPSDPQKVIEYCKEDVIRTREIYNRLTFAS